MSGAEHTPDAFGDLRELLRRERDRTRHRISALTGNLAAIDEASFGTAIDDEHDPEGVTIAYERSSASDRLADATAHLTEIDAAVARMDSGTYGVCESCGTPIPRARLDVRPTARTCVRCA